MAIKFSRKDGIFTLTTKNTAYAFQIAHGKYPIHIYYGKKSGKITPWDPYVISFSPYLEQFGNTWSPDVFPQEYSFFGAGDFRTPALRLKGKDGNSVTSFDYNVDGRLTSIIDNSDILNKRLSYDAVGNITSCIVGAIWCITTLH